MSRYFRPLVSFDAARPAQALPLAGGAGWFDRAECLERNGSRGLVPVSEMPEAVIEALTRPRPDIAGVPMHRAALMGILNVTPDSFSDGGRFLDASDALAQARSLIDGGADILDIGGESTRPGADFVPVDEEIARTTPVIAALAGQIGVPISIDTRKAGVAQAALDSGAAMLNDVSALSHDAEMAGVAAQSDAPICLMHAQGDPKTMQDQPRYENVLLDVYDYLAERIAVAEQAGISRQRIIVDPGIGFGKTLDHNLILLRNISLFHGLGCPVLVGASRKKFIGTISGAQDAAARMPGSVAVALHAISQAVQIVRVHDIVQTRQAVRLWQAIEGQYDGT